MAFRALAGAGTRTPRRPLSPRSANEENVPPEEKSTIKKGFSQRSLSQKSLSRPRSAGALPRAEPPPEAAEAAAAVSRQQAQQEEALQIEAAAAVDAVKAALASTSRVDISVLDSCRDDHEALREFVRAQPIIKAFDYKNNEAKTKEWTRKLRSLVLHQTTFHKVHGEAMTSVQEAINGRLRDLTDKLAAQGATHQAILNQVAQQARDQEVEAERRLEEAERRQQELSAAAERRETDLLTQLATGRDELTKTSAKLESAQQQLQLVREQLAGAHASLKAKAEQIENVAEEKRALRVVFDSYKEHSGTTGEQQMSAIAELKVMVGELQDKVAVQKVVVATKEGDVLQHRSEIEALQRHLQEEERKRREMHNAMQELKGNIRVFCRVRPIQYDSPLAVQITDAANAVSVAWNGESYEFGYDKVFCPAAPQEAIFEEVEGLAQSALDGYKVCIFAYGQTGSGKTYTMQGTKASNKWGVIPRALSQILLSAEEMRNKGWVWSLQASFMEVYNETIRDLLDDGASGASPMHAIIHDDAWGSQVTNMTAVEVDSMDQIRGLMAKAAKHRSVGNTDMNTVSSRSHAVFALYLKGTNERLMTELTGALHLVDLAGSERLDKSGSTGSRLRETQNINKSLSSLANVFCAKSENRSHIPFRNSKLTHLMEPCLSGHGKTLMVVNVGPEEDHAHETLCSLRFASKVSQCNTGGKPTRTARAIGGASGSQTPSAPPSRPGTPRSRPPTPPARAAGGNQPAQGQQATALCRFGRSTAPFG